MSSTTTARGELRIHNENVTKDICFGIKNLIEEEHSNHLYNLAIDTFDYAPNALFISFDAHGKSTFNNNAKQFFSWITNPEKYELVLSAIAINELTLTFEFKEFNPDYNEAAESIIHVKLDKKAYLENQELKTITHTEYSSQFKPDISDLEDVSYTDSDFYFTKEQLDQEWKFFFDEKEHYHMWLDELDENLYSPKTQTFEDEHGKALVVNPEDNHFVLQRRSTPVLF